MSACNVGDLGSIPGSGRSPGEGNGTPLQYSCLENPMDGGAWWATVHESMCPQTRLSNFTHSLFVYGVRERSSFILLHVDDQLFQHHLLKRLFFFLFNYIGILVLIFYILESDTTDVT